VWNEVEVSSDQPVALDSSGAPTCDERDGLQAVTRKEVFTQGTVLIASKA